MISEDLITEKLLIARGDIFVAASLLSLRPSQLDNCIRASESLQSIVCNIEMTKASPEYEKLSNDQFYAHIDKLNRQYKLEAMNVIYDIATIQGTANEPLSAAMMDVKLKAAIALRGAPDNSSNNIEQSQMMQELNNIYRASATRIKSIRVAQIDYDG